MQKIEGCFAIHQLHIDTLNGFGDENFNLTQLPRRTAHYGCLCNSNTDVSFEYKFDYNLTLAWVYNEQFEIN